MKGFLTQPRLQYFILSSLILPFLGGVTSQEAVINEYTGPDVSEGVRVRFTGAVNSTTGSHPTSISFFIITTNGPPDERICIMFFDDCNSTLNYKCYCNNSIDNTYYFVMQINATLERSGGTIYANIGGDRPKFPTVIAPTQRPPTTGAGDHTDHTGEIVGGVCGGLAGVALGICIYCICKKKKVCCWKGAPVKTGDPPATSATPAAPAIPATTIELDTTYSNSKATSQ